MVAVIIGTRPEAIKMAPVLRALMARGLTYSLVCTGQHPALDLEGAGVGHGPTSVLALDPHAIDADTMCDRIETLACGWLARSRPGIVLVHGDTNSALGAARAAKRLGISLGHVEAGLRTHDVSDPWPEERNRVAIDGIADLLFAPTVAAVDNLAAESVGGEILLTGNSGIDAVLDAACDVGARAAKVPAMLLVTVHRRENRGPGIRTIASALRKIASEEAVEICFPLHPNATTRDEVIAATRGLTGLRLLPPQSLRAMVALMLESHVILTDSGGIQEEAAALGRPTLVLRARTERPEVVSGGNALLVGTDEDLIASEVLRLLRDPAAHARMSVPAFPFGKGGAGPRIAEAVARFAAGSFAALDHAAPAP